MLRRLQSITISGAIGIISACLVLVGGCVGRNDAHCNFKSADYCASAHPQRPHCSICVADFDGCVESPPSASCEAESAASATAVETTSATTDDASTTGATTTSAETTDATSSGTTADTSGSATDTSTAGEVVCGDGEIDPPEVCDGERLDGNTCAKNPPWGGGTLLCAPTCDYFDFSGCCLGAGSTCEALNDQCCAGLECKMKDLLTYTCQSP